MKEDGRDGERGDACQPPLWAREPRKLLKRGDEVPSEFKANREWRETAGMKRCREVIVEVKDADAVAETNDRAAGELERSVTTPDLDAARRPHLRRCCVEAVKKLVRSIVDRNRPAVPRSRAGRRLTLRTDDLAVERERAPMTAAPTHARSDHSRARLLAVSGFRTTSSTVTIEPV